MKHLQSVDSAMTSMTSHQNEYWHASRNSFRANGNTETSIQYGNGQRPESSDGSSRHFVNYGFQRCNPMTESSNDRFQLMAQKSISLRPGYGNPKAERLDTGFISTAGNLPLSSFGESPFPRASSIPPQDTSFQWCPPSTSALYPNTPSDSYYRAISPQNQDMTHTPSSDSAYWSLPESAHGTCAGSTDRDRASEERGGYLGPNGEVSLTTASEIGQLDVPGAPYDTPSVRVVKPEKKERSRHDAHSKVEKRYRMNINNKIEQLRRILPPNPVFEHQYGLPVDNLQSTRRRKSSTELSKRDVLSASILRFEQLEQEVQELTSENLDLKQKITFLRSLAIEG